ncbi:conserved hypothetical protein [Gloeothece citriformis PCC 7424]|uniref:Uncharacterized protein n=1 Tax=Gloeothece citriformis (strain PCC 7424) TaxID=65393 RepID=B7KGW8_GLOC7|nr:DUF6391 domain-containing protein [Gloeothece citriformis]ACK73455.1 conserved hypothetical protein [Gloeothece citriformis PCC 7424]
MTNTFDTLWNFDWLTPHPTQDSDLLKQIGFIPGLKEFLMLRQVHALEHATVWVLCEMQQRNQLRGTTITPQLDNETLGGLSTEQGFYLYGQITRLDLQRAVGKALQRLQQGEWDLAVHPRCGTNLSVAMVLTAGLVISAHLLLPRGPIEQLIGLGLATSTAVQLAPDLGMSVQKYLTTSIPFNLKIVEIASTQDLARHPAYFVRVDWQDLQ